MGTQISDVGKQKLKVIFEQVDKDNDGRITKEELTTVMHDLGFQATEAQIDKMMKEADTNGNGSLDFEEFASAWQSVGGDEQGEEGEELQGGD